MPALDTAVAQPVLAQLPGLAQLPALRVLDYRVPPLAAPLTAAAAVVGLLVFAGLRGPLGRRVLTAAATFWALFVAVLTLSPQVPLRWQLRRGPVMTCNLAPDIGSATQFFATGDDWMNVLLYVPLGLLVALSGRAHRSRWYVVVLTAPVLVETFQALAADFYRTCQTRDVLTNWLGVLFGAGAGIAGRASVRNFRRSRRAAPVGRR